MSRVIKIHQGTARLTSDPMCMSCSHALIREGANTHITCTYAHPSQVVKEKIYTCTGYYNKNLPSVHDFEKIAWTLRTEKNGRNIGFRPPEKGRDEPY